MGFPSPAVDCKEQRLTIGLLCGIDGNCRVIETSCGWAVINVAMRPEQGDTLLERTDGRNALAKLYGATLITEDGEAIEGHALDEMAVFGVLTHSLKRVGNDDCPAI
jgi:DNA polymerase V